MRRALILHPTLRCPAVTAITVDVERPSAATLTLRYVLTGDVAALRIPPPATPARTDDLWKHTCFEVFLRPDGGEAYDEFNLSPSGRWAAYRFDRFREGMADAVVAADPVIALAVTEDSLVLGATLDLAAAPALAGAFTLAISAVIESADGALAYWGMAHPPVRPDFHHADGFVLDLAAPGAP